MSKEGYYTEAEANATLRTYVSERGFFIYRPCLLEFGTNKEHYAGSTLARLILQGLEVYEDIVQPYHFEHETIVGDIEEIIGNDDKFLGIRVKNPKFICEGLKEALNMPKGDRITDQLMLIRDADDEFSNFLIELAHLDVLDKGPRDTIR